MVWQKTKFCTFPIESDDYFEEMTDRPHRHTELFLNADKLGTCVNFMSLAHFFQCHIRTPDWTLYFFESHCAPTTSSSAKDDSLN